MIDIAVICAYLVCLPLAAVALSRRVSGGGGALLRAHHDLPSWAICLSLVATETSTLTFISVPGIGYVSGLVFAGLACGYLVGRIVVALVFLPVYARGDIPGVYHYLGGRFGTGVQRLAAAAFLATRLAAEGVRLMAGALPLSFMMAHAGLPLGQAALLTLIVAITLFYTMAGGLRAVVWSDAIQLVLYLGGAIACVILLAPAFGHGGARHAWDAGHLALFHRGAWASVLSDPFAPVAAVLGGAIMTMASHGTDQLMVQRVLAARSLRAAQGAMIGSAVVVGALFSLLSLIGVGLWLRAGGAPLGAGGSDALFPRFIATGLPQGLSGLLVAGTLSATMGSLSATMNAMAGVALNDFGAAPARVLGVVLGAVLGRCGLPSGPEAPARVATALWGVALVACALALGGTTQAAVIVGLTIAGWSYGPTLGAFLFGMAVPRARGGEALAGFAVGLAVMAGVLVGLPRVGVHIAFVWLVPLGVVAMLVPALAGMMLRGALSRL